MFPISILKDVSHPRYAPKKKECQSTFASQVPTLRDHGYASSSVVHPYVNLSVGIEWSSAQTGADGKKSHTRGMA